MSCPDCGANLDSVAPGSPCPSCGGSGRDATIYAPTIDATGRVFPPSVSVGDDSTAVMVGQAVELTVTMNVDAAIVIGVTVDPDLDLKPAAHFATSQSYYPPGMYIIEDETGTMPPEVFLGPPEQIAQRWLAWFWDNIA
jgi:hypothetical protein